MKKADYSKIKSKVDTFQSGVILRNNSGKHLFEKKVKSPHGSSKNVKEKQQNQPVVEINHEDTLRLN